MISHRQGYLLGEAKTSKIVNELVHGKYDLAIFSPSWDKRCLSVTGANNFESTYCIILLFKARDPIGLRDQHDTIIQDYVKSKAKTLKFIEGYSVNIEEMWNELFCEIKTIYSELGRPLNVFLDLSTCPRFYALAILGTCFRLGITESITIFYVEGIYKKPIDKTEDVKSQEYEFTKGHWRLVAIPALEGICDPGKKKYYFISVGFEGSKTMQVVMKEDPDRVSVLFPDPGIIEEYVDEALKANNDLIEKYKVPDSQIVHVHAADAIGGWKALEDASLERKNQENIYYLCCGTKPHAISLALRALATDVPAVLYRVPEKHEFVDISPAGRFWIYKIKDLSALV